jgi:hypothetical protein
VLLAIYEEFSAEMGCHCAKNISNSVYELPPELQYSFIGAFSHHFGDPKMLESPKRALLEQVCSLSEDRLTKPPKPIIIGKAADCSLGDEPIAWDESLGIAVIQENLGHLPLYEKYATNIFYGWLYGILLCRYLLQQA